MRVNTKCFLKNQHYRKFICPFRACHIDAHSASILNRYSYTFFNNILDHLIYLKENFILMLTLFVTYISLFPDDPPPPPCPPPPRMPPPPPCIPPPPIPPP